MGNDLFDHSFFGAFMAEALSNEEAVGCNAQGLSSLVMREAELLLEFLIIPISCRPRRRSCIFRSDRQAANA